MGKYYGWKNGVTFGKDLGNNKRQAIKEAKKEGLDCVLKVAKKEKDGEWVWEKNKGE